MAQDTSTINIDVDGAANASAQLNAVAASANRIDNSFQRIGATSNKSDYQLRKFNRSINKFNRALGKILSPAGKFLKTISKFGFIALAGELALFTAGLLAVKAALITGRAAANLYQVSLKGVSVAAAGVVAAVSAAAAAVRQFNEVSLSPYLGGGSAGIAAARRASAGISPRVSGLLGGEGTQQLTQSLVQGGIAPRNLGAISNTLFSLTGGNTEATVGLARILQAGDAEKSLEAIRGAAGFREDSLKGVTTQEGLLTALKEGGVIRDEFKSIGEDLANTFIGTAKIEFATIKELFADIGEPLLGPLRDSLLQVSRIIREDLLSITAIVNQAGVDSFAPTLVRAVDAVSEFFRSNIVQNIQSLNSFADSIVSAFRSTREFFYDIGGFLKQFEPAADVVIEMFKAMFGAAGGRSLFRTFSELVVANEKAFVAFGQSIGNVFGAILDLFKAGNSGFFGRLTRLADIMNRIAGDLVPAIGKLFEALMPIFDALPALITALANAIEGIVPVVSALATSIALLVNVVAPLASALAGPIGAALLAVAVGGKVGAIATSPGLTRFGGGSAAAGLARGVGIGALGTGVMDTVMAQNLGGLSGAAQVALGARLLGINLPTIGGGTFTAGASAAILGGTAGVVGGGIDAYRQGAITPTNAASSIGGGAIAGGTLLAGVGGMSALAATGVGAGIGAVVIGGMSLWGARNKDRGSDKFAEALDMYVGDLTDPIERSAQQLADQTALRDDLREALASGLDPDGDVFTEFVDRYRPILQQYIDDFENVDQERLQQLLRETDLVDQLSTAIDETETIFDRNLKAITDASGLAGDELMRLADTLGIDLYDAAYNLNNLGMMVSATMDRIDPTMGILPDVSRTSIGRQALTSTASARLNEFLADPNADTLNAFLQSASAAEIARGADPMTAAFGPIAALEQAGRTNTEARIAARELLDLTAARIEAETGGAITQSQIEQAYGSRQFINRYGERVSTQTGFGAAQGLVRAENAVESALSIGSRMDPSERIKILERRLGMEMEGLFGGPGSPYQNAGSIEEQNRLIDDYLLKNDQNLVDQISLLTQIRENTAQTPTIVVNGQVVGGSGTNDRAPLSPASANSYGVAGLGNSIFLQNVSVSPSEPFPGLPDLER